jgi:hypothetical protein
MKYIHSFIQFFSSSSLRTFILLTGTLSASFLLLTFIAVTTPNTTQKISSTLNECQASCSGTCIQDPQSLPVENYFCIPSGGGSPIYPSPPSGGGTGGSPGGGNQPPQVGYPPVNGGDCNEIGAGCNNNPPSSNVPTCTMVDNKADGTFYSKCSTDGKSILRAECTKQRGCSGFFSYPCPNNTVCQDISSNNSCLLSCIADSSVQTPTPSLSSSTPTPTTVSSTPTPTSNISNTPSPTLSQTPSLGKTVSATFALNVKLPGIGNSKSTGENTVPKHNERDFRILLYDNIDNKVSESEVRLKFDGTLYKGAAQLQNTEPGSYTVKIKSNNSLLKVFPGVIKFDSGEEKQTPQITLVSGNIIDSNQSENTLDITDYNSLLSYFGKSVNDVSGELADLNDDGIVNEKDVNILLRGFLIRKGD